MRQLLTVCAVCATMTVAASATGVPPVLSFQGRLTDSGGNPVVDSTYQALFTIYDAPTGGNTRWFETQNIATTNGTFVVQLGAVLRIEESVFAVPETYLAIRVTPDPELSPRIRLVTVPYSFHAARSDTASFAWTTANSSAGDITAVIAASGLSGGGDSGDVSLQVASGGKRSGHIMDETITSPDLAKGSVRRLSSQPTRSVRMRAGQTEWARRKSLSGRGAPPK